MIRRMFVFPLLFVFTASAVAETAYVGDRLTTALRFAPGEGASAIKMVESGAQLDVLERSGAYVRVRDAQGEEGWIEARLLLSEPPPRMQVDKLRAELTAVRGQLGQAQTQAKQAQAQAEQALARAKQAESALAQQTTQTNTLAKALADAKSAAARPVEPAPAVAPAEMPPTVANAPDQAMDGAARDASGFSLLWLGIAFAMLVVGFVSGVVWLRESIRRRSGGMYLKV